MSRRQRRPVDEEMAFGDMRMCIKTSGIHEPTLERPYFDATSRVTLTFRFLELPAELRDAVYDITYSSCHLGSLFNTEQVSTDDIEKNMVRLHHVNQQLRQEVMDRHLEKIVFCFDLARHHNFACQPRLFTWAKELDSSELLAHVKHLIVLVCVDNEPKITMALVWADGKMRTRPIIDERPAVSRSLAMKLSYSQVPPLMYLSARWKLRGKDRRDSLLEELERVAGVITQYAPHSNGSLTIRDMSQVAGLCSRVRSWKDWSEVAWVLSQLHTIWRFAWQSYGMYLIHFTDMPFEEVMRRGY